MVLSIERYNDISLYVKYHVVNNHRGEPAEEYLKKRYVSCNHDRSFMRLDKLVKMENSKVDYEQEDHKLFWLNIFAGNMPSNIKRIYHDVEKRDLPFFISEQEWRTNHRYIGMNINEKVARYISKSNVMTNKDIVSALDRYRHDNLMAN